jgi:hypothetical protein
MAALIAIIKDGGRKISPDSATIANPSAANVPTTNGSGWLKVEGPSQLHDGLLRETRFHFAERRQSGAQKCVIQSGKSGSKPFSSMAFFAAA